MQRRAFLQTATAAALASIAPPAFSPGTPGTQDRDLETLRDFRITKVAGFRHVCPRPKMVGKNSHLDNHGNTTSEFVLRVWTDQGIDAIGCGRIDPETARRLVGQTLDSFWRPGLGVVGPIGRADHVLYDLVGKALGVPAWKLLGGDGPEWASVYDGSIYFADLLPEHQSRGVARIVEEVESSLQAGHRAFKIKIGRGYMWMPRKDGWNRDLEVVRAIRKAVGPDIRLMVDSNNGFSPDEAIRWLDELDDELFFVEEMFPEQVVDDRHLASFLRSKRWKTRVADGESAGELDHFEPFLDSRSIDVLQPDIRAFGLSLQWALSRRIREKNQAARLAPHNWGSHLGLPMQLVLARGLPNVLTCEQDPSTSDLFDPSPWEFRDGKVRVPDLPGCGLLVREDVYRSKYEPAAWVVAASS